MFGEIYNVWQVWTRRPVWKHHIPLHRRTPAWLTSNLPSWASQTFPSPCFRSPSHLLCADTNICSSPIAAHRCTKSQANGICPWPLNYSASLPGCPKAGQICTPATDLIGEVGEPEIKPCENVNYVTFQWNCESPTISVLEMSSCKSHWSPRPWFSPITLARWEVIKTMSSMSTCYLHSFGFC